MGKILVAYYSYSGSTRKLAEEIALITDGDLFEIVSEKQYSFNYNTASKEIRSEIERGFCPRLLESIKSLEDYEYIFIGSPNWFKCFAPPVLTFLRNVSTRGKNIIPFCTHGGGGFGNIISLIRKECPDAEVLEGFHSTADFDDFSVLKWIENLKI